MHVNRPTRVIRLATLHTHCVADLLTLSTAGLSSRGCLVGAGFVFRLPVVETLCEDPGRYEVLLLYTRTAKRGGVVYLHGDSFAHDLGVLARSPGFPSATEEPVRDAVSSTAKIRQRGKILVGGAAVEQQVVSKNMLGLCPKRNPRTHVYEAPAIALLLSWFQHTPVLQFGDVGRGGVLLLIPLCHGSQYAP